MTDAERLARKFIACTEEAGQDMTRESGGAVNEGDTWTFEALNPAEQEGLIRTAKMMLDRGYVLPGPNL